MDQRNLRRAVLVSSLGTISVLVNAGVQISVAALCGASSELDGYLAATALPLFVVSLCGTSASYVLIPALARARVESRDCLSHLSTHILRNAFVVFVVIAVAGYALRSWTLDLLAPALSGEAKITANQLGLLTWSAVVPSSVTFILTAISQADERFRVPAMATVAGLAVNLLLVWALVPFEGMRGVALAALGGAVATAAILGVQLRALFARRALLGRPPPGLPITGALMLTLLRSAFGRIVVLVDTRAAAGLAVGSLAYIGYSSRIVSLLGTVFVSGIAVVLLVGMSASFERGAAEFYKRVLDGSETVLAVVIPLSLICFALREPLVALAFERGAFTATDTAVVASVFGWQLIAFPGMALGNVIAAAYYAKQEVRTLLVVSIVESVAYAIYLPRLVQAFGIDGVAIGWGILWNAGLLFLVLKLWHESRLKVSRVLLPVVRIVVAAAFAATTSSYIASTVAEPLVKCVIGLLAGTAGYLVVGWIVDAPLVRRVSVHTMTRLRRFEFPGHPRAAICTPTSAPADATSRIHENAEPQ